jgi:hypothetical protein
MVACSPVPEMKKKSAGRLMTMPATLMGMLREARVPPVPKVRVCVPAARSGVVSPTQLLALLMLRFDPPPASQVAKGQKYKCRQRTVIAGVG